jgi:uncharacterized protein (DUF2235 family)
MAHPQRLVLCFDGTWNTDRSNTNVSRLFRKIADQANGAPEQARFYDEGVGTRFGERVRGGVFGAGLDKNIRQGYGYLASQFAADGGPAERADGTAFVAGPKLYFLGFSRGAFTARSLAGLVNYLGVPDLARFPSDGGSTSDHPVVKEAWSLYAARPSPAERQRIEQGQADAALEQRAREHHARVEAFRSERSRYPVRIHFLGVWDTVGALGIPRVFDYAWIPRFSSKYRFHDTWLGRCVRHAYQAVAIDEHRAPYSVALWTARDPATQTVEQRWFPGAHSNVGGGYEDDLLPDPPLAWIAKKAAEHGLHFVNDRGIKGAGGVPLMSIDRSPAAFDLDGSECLSPVHDSYAEFLGGTYRLVRGLPGAGGRVYRRMLVLEDGIEQRIDETAFKKMDADPQYRPPNLAQAGRTEVAFRIARAEDAEEDLRTGPGRAPAGDTSAAPA